MIYKELFKNLKILFIDDEEIIRKEIITFLKYLVDEVVESSNGLEALKKLENFTPDLIITDLEMPHMSGLNFIQEFRKTNKDTCIIVLTANTSEEYLLELVGLHIEKYIVKPIILEKLISVIKDCRKLFLKSKVKQKELTYGYKYDWSQKSIIYEEKMISLTKKEILFLELLFKNIGKITTYEEFQRVVWKDNIMTDNALKSLLGNLRKKLPKDFIINLSGIGYKTNL